LKLVHALGSAHTASHYQSLQHKGYLQASGAIICKSQAHHEFSR